MNDEKQIINMINKIIPSGSSRLSEVFESDAEVVRIGSENFLFTMDEFSSEDMFRDTNPYILGWNIAVGAISDILACGGIPLLYAHAMTIDKNWSRKFIKKFSEGIAEAVKKSGCSFIGGDFGQADNWRYTASVFGQPNCRQVSRKGTAPGDLIYISGRIGAGNFEAALNMYAANRKLNFILKNVSTRFNLRLIESKLITEYATSCIDTSDGVFNALNSISGINQTGYMIKDLPYIKNGIIASQILSLPKTLLFLSECGEYELLFTIKQDDEKAFLKKANVQNLQFYKIGKVIPQSNKFRVLFEGNKTFMLDDLNIRGRDFDDSKEYLKQLIEWLRERS